MKKWLKKRRRRKFIKAVKILRKEADRHKAADHMMEFVAVNESHVVMRCHICPDMQP